MVRAVKTFQAQLAKYYVEDKRMHNRWFIIQKAPVGLVPAIFHAYPDEYEPSFPRHFTPVFKKLVPEGYDGKSDREVLDIMFKQWEEGTLDAVTEKATN